MKVVWLCHFSNPQIREHLVLKTPILGMIVRRLLHARPMKLTDFALWNTNAINQFNKLSPKGIDLYIVATHPYMKKKSQSFSLNGIHYVIFNNTSTSLWHHFKCRILRINDRYGIQNRRIANKIKQIAPDIVHLIGAENPEYALSVLMLPNSIPIIAQLQTLLSDPKITKAYPNLTGRAGLEKEILRHATYIGTTVDVFPALIRKYVKSDPIILNTTLALEENINLEEEKKSFDFVYFASSISKAADLAIEAFAIAKKEISTLSLDVIGGCPEPFTSVLKERIKELEIQDSVFFEGQLETHDDVISQIRKARYALLPLKTDIISGTIREAMCNGIPVVTTKTDGTPMLNSARKSVLISEIGDNKALADNMIKLVCDTSLADELRKNAAITMSENFPQGETIKQWVAAYESCVAHFHKGESIPNSLLNHK